MTSFDAVGTLGWIAVSPDGLQFAYSYDNGENGTLNIVDIRTSEILEQLPGASRTSWSPDGKLLAYLSSEFIIRNMESGNETKVKGDCVPGGNTMAWSPDSRFLAFNSLHVGGSLGYTWSPELFRDARICIIDSHTGKTRFLFPEDETGYLDPAWSPDGKEIAFVWNQKDGYDIFVSKADGSDIRQVTTDGIFKRFLVWN